MSTGEHVYVQDNLSLMTDCSACIQADSKCLDCQDEFDSKQTVLAHEIVDEGNVQYPKQWMIDSTEKQGGGHDWISPLVRLKDGSIREEYLEQVVHMEDRTFMEPLWLASNETVCHVCRYVCIASNKCPNCEEVKA